MSILVIPIILTSIDALCFETGSSTYGVHALCLLLGQESKRPRWQEEPPASSASSATAGGATRENADDAEPQPLPTNEQKARFKEEQKESEAIYLMRRYIGGVTGVLCPLP